MNDLSTGFIARLRSRDPAAWFELWEIFGPILRAQLARWGRGRIGVETVQDLSQETMAALSTAIDRHDPTQGARFSTWLLAIARYTLGDELDRRYAQKRGGGVRAASLDESWGGASPGPSPDASYERAVFEAKVEAALRAVERQTAFLDFEVFRQRVLEGKSGRVVAAALGTSEPTVSRRLAGVREVLKQHLGMIIARYSFTREEMEEAERNGLHLSPKKRDESAFDEAVAEVYHRICQRRAESESV
ncbi:MAG: sigma-70 family RNA polymerase sigma factor [Planctomycetota bacterium]|nr:sigma-70 family RNA polymerase sigma factor [Planctomycetota bacterium]